MSERRGDKVSLEDATRFLTERFGTEVRGVAGIDHGEWSSTFSFEVGRDARVIRFGIHLDDYERDRFAASLSTSTLPVPRVIEIGSALGRYYAVSERVFGVYLDDLDGSAFAAVLPALLESLDAMRSVVLPAQGFGDIDGQGRAVVPDWRSHLLAVAAPSDRLPGWRDRLDADPEARAIFKDAFSELEAVAPREMQPNLVHADLLNFNVLIDRGKPSAFLDWGCAMAGDFLYDVAWLMFCQFWYPAWEGVDILAAANEHFSGTNVAVGDMDRRLRACLLHIGLGSLRYTAFAERPDGVRDACRRLREVMDGSFGVCD